MALIVPSAVWSSPSPSGADGGAKEAIEGAVEMLSKLHDLLKKDAKVGVYASAKVDGPDNDDFAVGEDEKDLDDYILESSLDASAFASADNDKDDNPPDNPYNPNPGHYALITIKAQKKTPGGWQIVSPDPNHPGDMGDVWTVAQDDNDEINTGQTTGAAVGLFSKDGKDAEACFKAEVKNANKAKGKAFEFETKSVKKTKCSPRSPFRLTMGGYFLADEDMFQFQDLGGDVVRIVPLFPPVVDLFHTYWQRQETRDLFPLLRGYEGLSEELHRSAYTSRLPAGFHLTEDPAELADFTVVGGALSFGPLDVLRSGRTNLALLDEYFTSGAVSVVAPEHAQIDYRPRVTGRMVIHTGDDVSSFIGRPFIMPSNDRRAEPGSDPMVGVLISVRGAIETAVELASNTSSHLLHRRLRRAWDRESSTMTFKLTGMAIHFDQALTFSSSYG